MKFNAFHLVACSHGFHDLLVFIPIQDSRILFTGKNQLNSVNISVFISIHSSPEALCFQENISGQSVHLLLLILKGKILGHILSPIGSYSGKVESGGVFALHLLLLIRDHLDGH